MSHKIYDTVLSVALGSAARKTTMLILYIEGNWGKKHSCGSIQLHDTHTVNYNSPHTGSKALAPSRDICGCRVRYHNYYQECTKILMTRSPGRLDFVQWHVTFVKSSVLKLLHVTLLAPSIIRRLLDFGEI